MTVSRKAKAGVGLAAVGLLAAACGGGSSSTSKTTTGYNAALSYKVINPSTHKGGTLKLGAVNPFDSLDPVATYYGYSWDFRRLWDRQMFQFANVPGPGSLKLVPDISTDMGTASDNNKTWTYHIRHGVKFANGEAVTSKNIKYAIERDYAMDVLGTGGGGPTYFTSLLGAYDGPYKDKAADHLGLKTIDTPDDFTIVFHLSKPFSDINYLLALPTSTPVPIDVDQNKTTGGANYQNHPISSGPYKVDTYDPNKLLTLSRNPYWDPSTDPVHKAYPDNITLQIGLNKDTADQELLHNQLDFVIDNPMGTTARNQVIHDQKGIGKNADTPIESYTTEWFNLDPQVPPLDNKDCRLAVFYAIDKQSVIDTQGGTQLGGVPANLIIPPASSSYEKDYNPYPNGADSRGDLAKAKDELAKCGHPNGFTTKFSYRTNGPADQIALSVQNSLKRVGINIVLAPHPRSPNPEHRPAKAKALGLGIINFGWGADFPTDYGWWEFIADPRSITPVGNYNEGLYDDPNGSKLIDQALASSGADQVNIWKQFSHSVMDFATMLPIYYPKEMQAHSDRATNVQLFSAIFNYYDYMNVGVSS